MKYTLGQRQELARELRKQGLNCCQCVAMAFDDLTAADPQLLTALSAGFGSGFGASGEVCGAISGATMLTGLLNPSLPRPALYAQVRETMAEFSALNGSCICRELKKPGRKPCVDLITDTVAILHKRFEADGY